MFERARHSRTSAGNAHRLQHRVCEYGAPRISLGTAMGHRNVPSDAAVFRLFLEADLLAGGDKPCGFAHSHPSFSSVASTAIIRVSPRKNAITAVQPVRASQAEA